MDPRSLQLNQAELSSENFKTIARLPMKHKLQDAIRILIFTNYYHWKEPCFL